jgi:hypothetical protein
VYMPAEAPIGHRPASVPAACDQHHHLLSGSAADPSKVPQTAQPKAADARHPHGPAMPLALLLLLLAWPLQCPRGLPAAAPTSTRRCRTGTPDSVVGTSPWVLQPPANHHTATPPRTHKRRAEAHFSAQAPSCNLCYLPNRKDLDVVQQPPQLQPVGFSVVNQQLPTCPGSWAQSKQLCHTSSSHWVTVGAVPWGSVTPPKQPHPPLPHPPQAQVRAGGSPGALLAYA